MLVVRQQPIVIKILPFALLFLVVGCGSRGSEAASLERERSDAAYIWGFRSQRLAIETTLPINGPSAVISEADLQYYERLGVCTKEEADFIRKSQASSAP